MSDSNKRLEYECPCYKCLTFAICQTKEIQFLMKKCDILLKYLYVDSKDNYFILDVINLYTFFTIMGIKIKMDENGQTIKYKWKE